MFHIVSDTKPHFAGWKHPSADGDGAQERQPIFSRRGCAFRFSNLQLAISYAQFFQSQSRSCSVVEMVLDERNCLTELPVDLSIHFELSEIRKLLGAISTGGIQS